MRNIPSTDLPLKSWVSCVWAMADECAGVFWTGGSLNPARSFGPAVAIHRFRSTQWIYWVGPIAGSLFAVLIFKLVKSLEYESANPDPELGPAAPSIPTAKSVEVEKLGRGELASNHEM